MGKGSFSFKRSRSGCRPKKFIGLPPSPPPLNNDKNNNNNSLVGVGVKGKKKAGEARMWTRCDRFGGSELVECDKNAIIPRATIPARDLRILGPVFLPASRILAKEKAMVINTEFMRAIVTAEELLLLVPILPFADQLRRQLLPHKSQSRIEEASTVQVSMGLQCDLPFEFKVLEIALEVVRTYLDSSVAELEMEVYPVLDELTINVSTKNLELVPSLKSNLTHLLAQVQKVRDEIEHLLDDNEDMAHLYLTRKSEAEALLSLNSISPKRNNMDMDEDDVEDLEMLLEAYFMQLDGIRNKILCLMEYIDDIKDYVNIQLNNQRNGLIQLRLTLTIASFAIAIGSLIFGIFAMNISCVL